MVAATPTVSTAELANIARTLRLHVIKMIAAANSGHPGGSLSAVDIITALYFGRVLKHDPKNPGWPDRDRFILSKGHGAPALYAALAESGYFPVSELMTLRQVNSRMQGHPVQGLTPGVEALLSGSGSLMPSRARICAATPAAAWRRCAISRSRRATSKRVSTKPMRS